MLLESNLWVKIWYQVQALVYDFQIYPQKCRKFSSQKKSNSISAEPIYEKGNYEQYLAVNLNEKFTLDCEMVGRPRPVITWTKNG